MPLIRELRRRHVFRVAAAYVVVSWLLLQVADILLPTFAAPDWLMRALVLVLAIGLPVTLALAWVFDLTPEGIERTTATGEMEDSAPLRGGALNYIIIGVLAAAVALFALDKFVFEQPAGREGDAVAGRPSLAVLPFANFSGDAGNDPFANGLHDDLLTQLSKIDSIDVASRTSVMRYRGTELAIPEIGRQLKVTAVLEGSLQRSADRLRLNAQLIDAATDRHLWAETFDRELTAANVFALQSEIAKAIAGALRATLSPEEVAALDAVPTESLAAYDAYTRGRLLLLNGSSADLPAALAEFEQASRLDPDFAAARAGACEARLSEYSSTRDPAVFDRAERSCTRALTLDPDSAEVHIALGRLYRAYGDYAMAEESLKRAQFEKAEQSLRAALDLDDLAVEAHINLALVHARQDRLEEARAELERAAELAPDQPEVWRARFSFYYSWADDADRFAQAEAAAGRAAELDPDNAAHWNNLGSARYMREDYAGAGEAWQRSLAIRPTRTAFTNTGLALYYAGDFAGAAEMQRRAAELAPDDHRPVGRLAEALAQLPGREAETRQAFARAAELARESLAINDQDWQDWGMLALYLGRAGDEAGALDAANRSLELSARRAEALFYAAQARVALGQTEAVLDLLEETVTKDPAYRELVANEPEFDKFADEPRFRALMGEIE